MHRTRIKFCGITRPRDAVAAAEAGADAIGLVFVAASPRHITSRDAHAILLDLPPMVAPIALFVDAEISTIHHLASSLKIRTVQLHGNEPPEILAELEGLSIIKAVRCDAKNLASTLETWQQAGDRYGNLAGILLETAGTAQAGGTGVENNWTAIESALKSLSDTDLPPLIAAGGLSAANVGDVIHRLHPWAVDVSSGIEDSPGCKSIEKMQQFSDAVHRADQST